MVEVKKGTRVYNKKYGIGIITNTQVNARYHKGYIDYCSVWFEDQLRIMRVHRKELFVRGDKVQKLNNGANGWVTKTIFTFYAHLDHSPNIESNYTVKFGEWKIEYCKDVRHVKEYEWPRPEQKSFRFESEPEQFVKLDFNVIRKVFNRLDSIEEAIVNLIEDRK